MKKSPKRLKIAVQKKGRLNQDSLELLSRCGLKVRIKQNSLLCHVENLPIDILFVRDDDITAFVEKGTCDLGIVGENVLFEQKLAVNKDIDLPGDYEIIKNLGFSRCRLSIAFPVDKPFNGPASLSGLRIATSYPNLLRRYLNQQQIEADILKISGSVEIAPHLDLADAICDLVSTGQTLEENNLQEVDQVMQSQAVLIKSTNSFASTEKVETLELLSRRIDGVLKAQESKYIMFHAPKSALPAIKQLLPGFETPTIMPLEYTQDKVAVHVVSSEGVFWNTLEKIKSAGASSILVLPIEKMLS